MKTNIEKLEQLGIVGSVRKRNGADDANDQGGDEDINKMSNHELVAEICGWELGDDRLWLTYKRLFDNLEQLDM